MIKFDNKISIDGVAVIIAVIMLTVWLATMHADVTQNAKNIEQEKQDRKDDIQATKEWLQRLQTTQDSTAQSLAALTAIENHNATQ